MTLEPLTFLWTEIEGFRGFRDRQRIELNSSVVILTGPNGTGKTSFFDALQWLMLGSLGRLEPWRARKNTEHIANAFRGDAPAVVRVGLKVGGQEAEIERRGRYEGGALIWSDADGVLRGEEAQRRLADALLPGARDVAQLKRLLMTSALLEQDVVRAVLEDKPGQRYQQLESLLGLGEVRQFEAAARKRADRLGDVGRAAREEVARIELQHRQARDRVEALRAQQAAAPDTLRARSNMAERLQQHADVLRLEAELPAALAEALLFQTNISDLGDRLEGMAEDVLAVEARARELFSSAGGAEEDGLTAAAALGKAGKVAEEARAALQKTEIELAAGLRHSEAFAALANAALPLLGDRCPVCEQPIVQSDVERHLRELIEQGGADLPRLEAQSNAARAAAAAADKRRDEAAIRFAVIQQRDEGRQKLQSEREQLRAQVQAALERAGDVGIRLLLAPELQALAAPAFTRSTDALREASRAVADLSNVLRALPTGDTIAAAEGEVRRIEALLTDVRTQASVASAREEEARTLQRAGTRAAASVADIRFRDLAPLIADIFSRLDPHPVFKALDFALGVYRERGEARPVVKDLDETVEAEPLIVLSSSQANVAALSYFLALGWAAGAEATPFVLLDDPLQSLDDVNALGFADLCRHIRQQRQLIISTHDRRLASLLERKLAPRASGETTRIVRFTSWTRSGPELDQRLVEPQLREGSDRRLIVAA
jgi:DNA repair exonuclease SbcCD ATPase subunit